MKQGQKEAVFIIITIIINNNKIIIIINTIIHLCVRNNDSVLINNSLAELVGEASSQIEWVKYHHIQSKVIKEMTTILWLEISKEMTVKSFKRERQ